MNIRSTETTVTFKHPFNLEAFDGKQPAGIYRLVVDEEEIIGLSFLAYRRTATMLHIPALSAVNGKHQVFQTNPREIEAALRTDQRE
jgi:hypothetical protein